MKDGAFSREPYERNPGYRAYSLSKLRSSVYWSRIPYDQQEAIVALSHLLPFRVNEYVLGKLIDWDAVPDDPIYRLVFPHSDMLDPILYARLLNLLHEGDSRALESFVRRTRYDFNPHPAGQVDANVRYLGEDMVDGLQHKYRQTALIFPANGQTCHAYCSFCFRWPQFVNEDIYKFRLRSFDATVKYLEGHPEITDVLITGGDPLIMTTDKLRELIQPLLAIDHIQAIRIGTKAVGFWPYRFYADSDSDELTALFKSITRKGRHLGLMLHVNHPREIDTPEAAKAIERIHSSGAIMRIQSPLIRHVNDHPHIWAQLWKKAVRLGCVPYYMFIARDTGPQSYFQVPLITAYDIYRNASKSVSGLARTARGPSMSCYWGKVLVDGVVELMHSKYFVLRFLQARDERFLLRPFLAQYNEDAYWFDDMVPAFGDDFDLGEGVTLPARKLS